MASIGSPPGAEAHIAACGASVAEIQAIRANVGVAARPSQLPASRISQTRGLPFFAIVDAFIFRLSDRLDFSVFAEPDENVWSTERTA